MVILRNGRNRNCSLFYGRTSKIALPRCFGITSVGIVFANSPSCIINFCVIQA